MWPDWLSGGQFNAPSGVAVVEYGLIVPMHTNVYPVKYELIIIHSTSLCTLMFTLEPFFLSKDDILQHTATEMNNIYQKIPTANKISILLLLSFQSTDNL